MDIDGWLRGIGLPQYAELFRANDIDGELLGRLTNDDLKDIGIASFGHRKKLLQAIAELGGGPMAAPSAPSVTPAPILATTAPALISASVDAAGERRYLTVMFCDLVGSSGIAAKLDAEEWRDLVGAYLDAASAAVTEMGGHVAKKLGDGLLALFGYPVAQENDAERAARAALSVQRALAELNRKNAGSGKPELAARVGLDTGPAVVDAAGEIYGDVANVAARVQALAEPGAVLITAQMQRQIAGLFVVEDRGSHTLKGVPEPTALYRLIRASGGGRRSAQRNLTPLVGREEELALLMRRWERVRQGEGQLVLVIGEPGIGKSRLIEEFHARLRDTPHTWAEWTCSQLLQNTPFHPIAEWGRQRFGGADVPAEQRLADLESSLAQVKLDPAEYAPLLAPMLDIPLPKERAPALSAEELRRRQLAATTNWAIAGARVQPVVLALEDLHWADPTTLDVLRGIAERGALAPLFIVATTRPEFRPPWSMRSHHGTISLAPLDRAQVRDMVVELSARHALSKEVVEDVAARTGGVPLFVEEVTRLLLERGEQGGIHTIPPTLQQSLMARLDRLGPSREVAQIGAVIGRGFSYGLLRDVAGQEDAALQAALERLAEADIVLVQGAPPESDYRFKHALIQDAAYENLLKSRRQALHRRVAETLRDRFADNAAEPEVLAHHFTQAGMTDPAIEWWGKAGDQALRRSAFQEAIAHLGKAIEMADKEAQAAQAAAPQGGDRLRLQISYGNALISARGYGAQETTAAFARARELAAQARDAADRFSAYYGLWVGPFTRGQLAPMQEVVQALLRDCEDRPASPEASIAHRLAGTTNWYAGDFEEARKHLEHALAIFDPQRDRDLAHRFGHDVGVAEMAYLALVRWSLGEVDDACRLAGEMVRLAIETGHIPTVVYGHMHKAIFELMRRNPSGAAPHVEAFFDLARKHVMPNWVAYGRFLEPWERWHLGVRDGGLNDMRNAVTMLREQGVALYTIALETVLAEVEAEVSQLEPANATVDRALAETERTGHRWFEAETHRIRGEILLKRNPVNTAPAEEAFLTAIAVAQQQKARSFELRAVLSLAKLYQSIGRAADAHAVLAPALEGFSPTPEFPEIAEARELLSALAKTDEVKNADASRKRRLQLQVSLANAMLQSHGQHATETKAAFDRARELAASTDDPLQRFSTYYGLWVGGYVRGEKATMTEAAESLLKESDTRPDSGEAGIAHRIYGVTCWMARGDLSAARDHLEKAVALYRPERDCELVHRFGQDVGVAARAYLSLVLWVLGECDRSRAILTEMMALAAETKHAPTLVYAHYHAAFYETFRLDPIRTKVHAETCLALARERGLEVWTLLAPPMLAWANANLRRAEADWEEMRRRLADARQRDVRLSEVTGRPLLAAGQSDGGQTGAALATIDQAIAEAQQSGICAFDPESNRIRGEILLKRDAANSAPAEEAFLTAIAVAQVQKARSFELRAALSLAKLYQSTGRAADAHAVLVPALEGFSPTPEFPEIEEAQATLATLAQTDEVRNVAAVRHRRLKLQADYGQALMWSKGFGSQEAKTAFVRAKELAAGVENPDERFAIYYGQWVGSALRGELGFARETVETFLREANERGARAEAAVAHRVLGLTCHAQGEFTIAQQHLEEALKLYDPQHDREVNFRFGQDTAASARAYLAHTDWQFGKFERMRELMEEAVAHAVESTHPPTLANVLYFNATLEALRGDAEGTLRVAEMLGQVGQAHGLALYQTFAAIYSAWARARTGDRTGRVIEFQDALAAYTALGNRWYMPLYRGLLAELEAEVSSTEQALTDVQAALALAGETGEHWTDAYLHRIRGEILLKRDSADTAPAEEAFLTAIAIAQQQRARSFELRAALSLAKLYQSIGRAADAHAVLAPALKGFSPIPDFPEIAEPQALLAEQMPNGPAREP